MTTQKKQYEKPSTKVFELQHRPMLLVGSNGNAGVQNYTFQDETEE